LVDTHSGYIFVNAIVQYGSVKVTRLQISIYLITLSIVLFGPFILNLYLISKKLKRWGVNEFIVFCATVYPIGRNRRKSIFDKLRVDFSDSTVFFKYQIMYLAEVLVSFIVFQLLWRFFK